jgi:hypothetical protein
MRITAVDQPAHLHTPGTIDAHCSVTTHAHSSCAPAPRSPSAPPPRRLNLSIAPVLEKNMEFLNDCLDDLMVEQNKLSMYHQQLRRHQQQVAQWKLQRMQENKLRRAAGACAA